MLTSLEPPAAAAVEAVRTGGRAFDQIAVVSPCAFRYGSISNPGAPSPPPAGSFGGCAIFIPLSGPNPFRSFLCAVAPSCGRRLLASAQQASDGICACHFYGQGYEMRAPPAGDEFRTSHKKFAHNIIVGRTDSGKVFASREFSASVLIGAYRWARVVTGPRALHTVLEVISSISRS